MSSTEITLDMLHTGRTFLHDGTHFHMHIKNCQQHN